METQSVSGATRTMGVQKILCWLMAIVMAVGLMPLPAYAAQSEKSLMGGGASLSTQGDDDDFVSFEDDFANIERGTADSPYRIKSENDLIAFRNAINADKRVSNTKASDLDNKYYRLLADIAISSPIWDTIAPYGDTSSGYSIFTGHFDGDGKTISNVNICNDAIGTAAYMGFFGYAKASSKANTEIKNLKIEGISIVNNSTSTSSVTGGIVGQIANNGSYRVEVTNCVTDIEVKGMRSVGGIVGSLGNNNAVSNCLVLGDISSIDNASVAACGGIVGAVGGTNASLKNSLFLGQNNAADTTNYTVAAFKASTNAIAGKTLWTSENALKEALGSNRYYAQNNDYVKSYNGLVSTSGTAFTNDDLIEASLPGDSDAHNDLVGRMGWSEGSDSPTALVANNVPGAISTKQNAMLSLSSNDLALTYGSGPTTIGVTYDGDGEVVAQSSDSTVASVGEYDSTNHAITVTPTGNGSAKITVTAAATDQFNGATATVDVTVTGGPTRYSVTFATDSGSAIADQSVSEGDTVQEPGEPTKSGYIFDGWYVDNDESGAYTTGDTAYSFDTPVTASLDLVAKWDVSVGLNFTVTPATATVVLTDTVTNAVITETGSTNGLHMYSGLRKSHAYKATCTAAGYQDAEKTIDLTGTSGATATVSCSMTAATYTITYNNLKDASDSTFTKQYTYNVMTVTLPTELEATGYSFDGWYSTDDYEGTAITEITKGSTGDKVFYAKWTPVDYDITYNLDGGTNASANPAKYNIETDTITLADPTRSGYYFTGWTTDEVATPTKALKIEKGSTGAKTFNANWVDESIIKRSNITYNNVADGDWSGDAGATSYVEGEVFTLPTNVVRAGYAFKGWYDNGDFSGNPVTEIPATETGAKAFWAKWVSLHTITWKNDEETLETDANVEYGSTPSYDGATPTKAEDEANTYVFAGWNPEPATVTGDATYTAKFSAVTKQSKAALSNTISTAESTLAKAATTAEAAANVEAGTHYVTAAQKQALQTAISDGKAVVSNDNATQDQVTKATESLLTAITSFESALETQVGTKQAAVDDQKTSNQPESPSQSQPSNSDKSSNSDSSNGSGASANTNAENVSSVPSNTGASSSSAAENVEATSGSTIVTVDIAADGTATVTAGAATGKTISVDTVVTADGTVVKVTAIAANAFKGTTATKVVIGDSVETIGASAFANAKSLTTVTVGKNVKTIGANAFKGAKKLKNVKLGKNVKSIGKNAFKGCKKLKTLKLSTTKLTKKACKNMLKGSSVKTIKLTGMSKAAKKKALKNYKKWFPSKVAGKKLVIK